MTEFCKECPVFKINKPKHCIDDYSSLEELDILFLSDSVKWNYGNHSSFRQEEMDLIVECLHPMYDHIKNGLRIDFSSSVKCPNIAEADMSPDAMKSCRSYLSQTIDRTKPKLVFTCGNLAMKMLVKESGMNNKRGRSFTYTSDNGHVCKVVPIFHPFSVVKEPRLRYLFELDIRNGYNKYILGNVDRSKMNFEGIHTVDDLPKYEFLKTINDPISIDIETTGLDFKTDLIQSIAFGYPGGNVCFPIDHKYTPFDEGDRALILEFISDVLANPTNKKVFQNHTFDRKFLMRYGIECTNVWDTKLLAKLIREDAPNGLKSLVSEYFADELEDL